MDNKEKDASTTTRRSTVGSPVRKQVGVVTANIIATDPQYPTKDDSSVGSGGAGTGGDDLATKLLPQEKTSSPFGVGPNVMSGLTVAGMAVSLLTTVFGLFHVDTFLTAYQLPVEAYSVGNIIYAVVNAANDVAGAWIVDQIATSRKRSDLVGMTGCIFAICFLTPFFRYKEPSSLFMDGAHFVLTMSLYDTMFSFALILHGSIVSDDHEMSDATRVRFLAICKIANLVASFGVARVGLYLFDTYDMYNFRFFLIILFACVCSLSILSQGMIAGDPTFKLSYIFPPKVLKTEEDTATAPQTKKKLQWRQVAKDFWNHKNFRAWIGMEMLLESQNTFNNYFRKTFMDRLVMANGIDKDTCDWMISFMKPLTVIVSLAVFVPMRKIGYPKVYRIMFATNFVFSVIMLAVADSSSANWIIAFLFIYPTLTTSVLSSGFALGMADMVMDMKHHHFSNGRYDEPSLAAMFMGANALLCKPTESILPVVAAQVMTDPTTAKDNLYYMLILPPLIFSIIQLLSWSQYTLEPQKVGEMKHELKKMISSQSDAELA